jgi:hypothetical protein
MSKLSITLGRGFHMTFENGVTCSIQFGVGNYCNNRDYEKMDNNYPDFYKSANAEVAAWREGKNEWITGEYFKDTTDPVKGWVSPDEIADFISWCKNYGKDK